MNQQRIEQMTNPAGKRLLEIIESKQSRLAVSADVTDKASLLRLAEQVAPAICLLKTHADIITDFDQDLVKQLRQLADQHHFLIFEDRKFADIGHTVQLQYEQGVHRIADWADIIDAHPLPGPGIIEGLSSVGQTKGHGLLLLAQMSSRDNLITADYTEQAVVLAKQYPEFVMGFICQQRLTDDPRFIHCTPGVQLNQAGDNLGQQYITPQQAISNGSDVIIVGRGIYQAEDPASTAKQYRDAANSN